MFLVPGFRGLGVQGLGLSLGDFSAGGRRDPTDLSNGVLCLWSMHCKLGFCIRAEVF